MANLTYSKDVFEVSDENAAKRIILTPEFGEGTDQRWERETPYLTDLIGQHLSPSADGVYIDYGCGIGRLSKTLIERFGCRVLGVDISERMRALAPDYVRSQNFSVISPHMLQSLVGRGLRVQGGFSVWVLQHCALPAQDIALLHGALQPSSRLLVVNMHGRAVPTVEGRWGRDGISVRKLLQDRFGELESGELDETAVQSGTKANSYWATFTR